jgi:outer membrane lipoprotein-sorting protein
MLRKFCLFAFFLLIISGVSASAQTADEVIAKNIKATGGEEKLKAIKSLKTTGKLIIPGGFEGAVTILNKSPQSVRQEISISGQSIIQAYDGSTAWQINPFSGSKKAEKLAPDSEEAKDLLDSADIGGPLLDYKAKGHKVEFLGKEDLEGSPVFKLKLTKANGDIQYHFIDAESGLELKTSSKRKIQGNEIETEQIFSDYKEVNGLTLPFAFEAKAGGKTQVQVVVEKIEQNVPLDDTLFHIPADDAKPSDKKPGGNQ